MDKYLLTKTFRVFFYNEYCLLNNGSKQKVITNELWENNKILFYYLLNAHTKKDILLYAHDNNIDPKIIEYVLNSGILINEKFCIEDSLSRSQLFLNYFEGKGNYLNIFNTIKNTTFLIFGCGGIGNNIAYALASIGAKKFVLVDNDIVEHSNLNRQFLFRIEDVNKNKVEILSKSLKERFTDLEISMLHTSVNWQQDYEKKRIIKIIKKHKKEKPFLVLSADELEFVEYINLLSTSQGIPLLNVGYLNDIAVIGPFYIPGETSCLFCNSNFIKTKNKEDLLLKSINEYCNKAPSWYGNNSMAVNLAVRDILFFLNNDKESIFSFNKKIGCNIISFEKFELNYKKTPIVSIVGNWRTK